jgi:M6 family metalloprotease-like protein
MKSIVALWIVLSIVGVTSALAQPVPPAPGVELPQAYFDRVAEDRTAFQFQKAWIEKARKAKEARRAFLAGGRRPAMELASLPESIRSTMVVSGTVQVPVLLGKFLNTVAAPYPASDLQTKLFAPPPALSMTGLYNEMSYGNVYLTGTAYDWATVSQPDVYYEAGCNGVCSYAKTGQFLLELLQAADDPLGMDLDFGQYDNDGPDGNPNSGDDDGFVDFVAFVHPETGGECGTTNLWSHRWVVGGWPEFSNQPWVTNDARTGGGSIVVWDYTIQPALGSDNGCGTGINEIGVFCHEFGHAFGLPDLYDTNGGTQGIGHWGLMGSGNWNSPKNPAHFEAWSKAELGWLFPMDAEPSAASYTIHGAGTTAEAYRLVVPEQKFSRKSVLASWKMHCGLTEAEADARGWPLGAGYGNMWNESVRRSFAYDGSDPVTLEYDYMVYTEQGYDFGYIKIDVNGTVSTLAAYDNVAAGHAVIDLTPYLSGSGAGSYTLIAQFQSDMGYSDEDGNFNAGASGPFAIDNVSVMGGGESYFANFEQHENGWYYDFEENPPKEYFLVENRDTAGIQFDQQLHGVGLAIWHIEQNMMEPEGLGNTGGEYNTTIHGLALEEADGLNQLTFNRGDAGDVFPGTASNTTFDNTTTPGSVSHNGYATLALVQDIGLPGAEMSATLRGGFPTPFASAVTPNVWYNDREPIAVTITGGEFLYGATVLLRDAALDEYEAESVEWLGRGYIAAVLDVSDLDKGKYEVVVRNPDDQEGTIVDGFEVRTIVPVFIQAFDARATDKGVVLTWDIWTDEAVDGFQILRSEAGAGDEVLLADGRLIAANLREFVDDTVLPATDYEYTLSVALAGGAAQRSQTVAARSAGYALGLMQNVPNPFNPTTAISFSLPERMPVTLAVYDTEGREIARLVDGARPAGVNQVVWDGRSASGGNVASGVYFYRLEAGNKVLTKKMLLLK